jgi:hypothetical protein
MTEAASTSKIPAKFYDYMAQPIMQSSSTKEQLGL